MKKWYTAIVRCLAALLLVCSITSCESLKEFAGSEEFLLITSVIAENEVLREQVPGFTLIAESANKVGSMFEEFSPENEYFIGRSVAGSILNYYTLADTPEMNRYLTTMANSLAALCVGVPHPMKGYFVAILDSPEINAFATSGGHIFITRGFVEAMENEDQMAAVIAHEMSHIQLKHGLGSIKNSRNWEAVKSVASTGYYLASDDKEQAKEVLDAFQGSVEAQMDTMMNSGYSKEAEFNADKHALYIMNAAGYNIKEMTAMLKLITKSTQKSTGMGKTHPTPEKRIAKLQSTYKELTAVPTDEARTARFMRLKKTVTP